MASACKSSSHVHGVRMGAWSFGALRNAPFLPHLDPPLRRML